MHPGRRPEGITVGCTAGLIIPAVSELRCRHPDAAVTTVHLPLRERRQAPLDHRVDAVVTRLPFATDGLEVTRLSTNPAPTDVRPPTALTEAFEDMIDLTAAGQTVITTVPAHPPRPDLTTIPPEGAEPSHVVLATRTHDPNPLVTAFRAHARSHLTGQGPTGLPAVSSEIPTDDRC
ncbi:hypothetical protein ACMATS_34045 [Streptoverticillium reticulum]|uniref:hypothetical protein n=1 Tax=Streptoverticillium reticulum TaxID=1433415 RepID=UPI0039BF2C5A